MGGADGRDKSIYYSRKKYFHTGIALLQSFLCSGVIFGWPSLVQIFQEQNVYANLCSGNEVSGLTLIFCLSCGLILVLETTL